MGLARKICAIATPMWLTLALSAPPASADPDVTLAERLDAAIAAKIAEMGVPGAIVGISVPGDVDYVNAVGVADTATGAPMSVADQTRVASVTKTFTGTAVLQLVDQGRLSLQDPISRYVDGVPNGDIITLDLLGRMRSGLFDYSNDPMFQRRLAAEAPSGSAAFGWTPRQLVDVAASHPVNFPPGSKFEYCNTNFVLLGLAVEKITGQPLGDYLQHNVFDPLGLARTSYPDTGVMPEPFTHGYAPTPDGAIVDATFWNPSWGDAAGRIVSDYADMTAWARAVGEGALLGPHTQAQRLRMDGLLSDVGYGFALLNAHGWIGHNGEIPGYTTVVVYLPERDATLVVLANSDVPGEHSAGQLATLVSSIVTPDHVYSLAG
jgi:D-alanyl-D-alanine carboxypeptidase